MMQDREKTDHGYRVGIYVRESRDDYEENYETLETQRDLLIDFVEKKRLGQIYDIYVDDNVSGSEFDREGLSRLKKDILDGKIDLLVLKDLSRLGRNNAKTLLFLDFLEERGVRVLTYDLKYDSLKDNDTVGIETWFNERYVRDISRKIRANLRFKIQKGEYIGHAPFGFRKSETEKNRLCVESSEAEVVREIYRLYLEGYGYLSIAKKLNEKGCPSPSGKSGAWNAVAIRRILTNRVYIGDTVQGVSEKISYKSKKTRRIPQCKWVITTGTHEPIIDESLFLEVQRKIGERRGFQKPHKGELHLFRGLLYCGRCKNTMFARARENRPMSYICGTYSRQGIKGCTSHHIREEVLEKILLEELQGLLGNIRLMEEVEQRLKDTLFRKEHSQEKAIRLKSQLEQKKRQQEVLYLDRLEGRISEQLFLRMNQQLEGRIAILEAELERISGLFEQACDTKSLIRAFAEEIREQGLTHALVSAMVDRITIYDPGEWEGSPEGLIVIDFRFEKVD